MAVRGSMWSGANVAAVVAALVPLGAFAALALAAFSTSRLLLCWQYAAHFAAAGGLHDVLLRAWRFDLVVVSAVCILPALVHCLGPGRLLRSRWWRNTEVLWLAGWLVLIVWNEAATPDFFGEFGVRPNRLYIEYLGDFREVLPTLWGAHRVALITGLLLAAASALLGWRVFRRPGRGVAPWPLRVVMLMPVVLGLAIGVRGSTGHRPLNISSAASSADALVNQLPLNSTYSALYALWQMRRETSVLVPYAHMATGEVVARVRADMQLEATAFTDPAHPSEHLLVPTASLGRRPNIVILLQESLGAQYFRSLGGEGVATELDKWRGRSLWFDQLYATGTRSARGLEAVVTGFLPTRTPSVIKLEDAQHGFFTIARALGGLGYDTEFIYGGDSSFDNMRRFFLGNGFDHVIDQQDLAPDAGFSTTWGVADEYLYDRVHREVSRRVAEGRPYLALVFSTSNHPPYEYPPGRIQPFESPANTPRNAARYADFAVARYLRQAECSVYWDNTVFVVVADHQSRTTGDGLVPVSSFHVPAFIAGGPVRPRIVTQLASQIDLLPTALSLAGAQVRIPATGLDYSRGNLAGPGRAIMQFHDTAAYRVANDVVILAPGRPPGHYRLGGTGLVAAPADEGLARQAIALTNWPLLAYARGWYR
jgi:phosphoglycerol transferase MdoB-like AlkP superfamily enzyme